jgi:putative ABC transport system permease protein
MVGLALVTFVAAFGKTLVVSDEDAVSSQLGTSYVVTSQSGWDTVPVGAGRAAARAGGVQLATSVRGDRGLVRGGSVDVSGVDPATIARGYRFTWQPGSEHALAELGANGAIVRQDLAKEQHLQPGDTLELRSPVGTRLKLVVRGVYEPAKLDSLLGHVVVTQEVFDRSFPRPADLLTFANASSRQALERALAAYPDAKVATQDEFVRDRTAWLSSLMNLFYVLLALSVVVSLFGMVNTMVLSVFERTREIGMLRAVGMTRRQTRRMVRHEAVVTSLIGAALGIALGVGLTALTTQALGKYGVSFSLPTGSLVAFALVALVAGVLAAILPARRAARLDVLQALHAE